jgi:hypothetical protein
MDRRYQAQMPGGDRPPRRVPHDDRPGGSPAAPPAPRMPPADVPGRQDRRDERVPPRDRPAPGPPARDEQHDGRATAT